ncbi:MAG: Rieske 2Fe-2S domain-containing protein [Proteobacteria bacterium]|nr:Rieske 2Fe-2S domain-containing protein [Pseudomonadota bacterium]
MARAPEIVMGRRVFVCQLAEVVPEELRSFAVAGMPSPVIVAYIGPDVVAVAGACPHKGVDLVDGYLHDGALMCPAHAYMFDLRSGRCKNDPKLELRRYLVAIVDDQVWIELR